MAEKDTEVWFDSIDMNLQLVLLHILNSVVRKALYDIYNWGCEKSPNMSVKEYLREKGYSNLKFMKYFTKHQRAQIEEDPQGHSYDITLLYCCIRHLCNNIGDFGDPIWSEHDTLESTLQDIKRFRNELVHSSGNYLEEDISEKIEYLKRRVKILYKEGGERYDVRKETTQLLTDKAITEIDLISEKYIRLVNYRRCPPEILARKIRLEQQELFKKVFMIDLSCDIPGFHKAVDVYDFFTSIDLYANNDSKSSVSTVKVQDYLSVQDILEVKSVNGKTPNVIIIEGSAGSGKTTLSKVLLSHWCKETDFIKNLKERDLIFFMECRNQTCKDLEESLQMLMPTTFKEVTRQSLNKAIRHLKVLVIVDGFDEVNETSHKLFNKLVNLDNHNMLMLVTTREAGKEALCKAVSKMHEICFLKIAGVPQDRLPEFILKWHGIMQSKSQINKEVNKLCGFIHNTPWGSKLITLPLNLTLLIWLWTQEPKRIELLKTSTSLYNEIVKLMTDRLINRLCMNKVIFRVEYLKDQLSKCLKVIFRESLNALRQKNFNLSKDLKFLEDKCSHFDIPYEDVVAAFFSIDANDQRTIFVPKGFCEFYAALAICDLLRRGSDDEILQNVTTDLNEILIGNKLPVGLTNRIRKEVKKMLRENLRRNSVLEILKDLHYDKPNTFALYRYQKVLIHLIGLLKNQNSLSQQRANELVDLLIETDLKNPQHWLNILTETDCDINIVEKVKNIISRENFVDIKDGNLKAAACVLQNVELEYVNIEIISDPCKLEYLKPVLQALSSSNSRINLNFLHHWYYPEQGSSDEFLHCLLENNHRLSLTHFKGSVKCLSALSMETDVLYLALGTPYANHGDQKLDFIANSLPDIEHIYLHLTCGIDVECIPELPKKFFSIDLWFSGVDDTSINWVASAVEKLSYGYRPFWSIRFPRSTLTAEGCIKLAKHLKGRAVIGKDGIIISSTCISKDDIQLIEVAFCSEVSCSFCLLDEVRVWSFSM